MSMPSEPRRGRFKQVQATQARPDEQILALANDGARMYARFENLLRDAAHAGDLATIMSLAQAGSQASDYQRAYATQRLTVAVLITLAQNQPKHSHRERSAAYVNALEVLTKWLERQPKEPELLLQLAQVLAGLGQRQHLDKVAKALDLLEPEKSDQRRSIFQNLQVQKNTAQTLADESDTTKLRELLIQADRVIERSTSKEEKTISLCMIVRDEEAMLEDCLSSVDGFVDQMVIVDTGSTDRTVEIAKKYGATVVDFEWTGSFSDARNESLKHATGDWVLWLDADERLASKDGPLLRELSSRVWVEGFHVIETHLLGNDGSGAAAHEPMRLFQRRSEYHWRGTIHEQVAWSLPTWIPDRVQRSHLRITHLGYMSQVVDDRGKKERNIELLRRQHEDDPSAFTSYNLGSEFSGLGQWSDALSWLERALHELRIEAKAQDYTWYMQPWAPLLTHRTMVARRMTGDFDGALTLAKEGLELWPEYTDLVWEQAHSHLDKGDYQRAAQSARTAISMGDAPARYVAVAGKGSYQARELLARALSQLGDNVGAQHELEQALREEPHYHPAVVMLMKLLAGEGWSNERIDEHLDQILSRVTWAGNLAIGFNFHEVGAHDLAQQRYERVLETNPKNAHALSALSELMLVNGDLQSAWDFGMGIDELDRLAYLGGKSATLAAAALGDRELFAQSSSRVESADALPASERSFYAAWKNIVSPTGAISLVPSDEAAQGAIIKNLAALAKLQATDAFEELHELMALVFPEPRSRGMAMANLYVEHGFADLAGEELMNIAEHFGPDASVLTGLGKVATLKGMWDDALVLLEESLVLDPAQRDAKNLVIAVRERMQA